MDNIRGKTIAITGAARGIGFATARALLQRGARVVIGDRDVALEESAVAQLGKLGPVSGYPLDVTDPESFATFLDKARADGGGHIDVLINNAGVMPVGPFLDHSEQAVRTAVEVNFYGVLTGCRLVLPEMVRRRDGHIVNIASLAGMLAVRAKRSMPERNSRWSDCRPRSPTSSRRRACEISCVMPTFTNTELIAGTHQRRHQAGATRGHRRRRRQHPRQAEIGCLRSLLRSVHGRRDRVPAAAGRRWLSEKMGTDRVFLDFDTTARAAYEQRAQTATGVLEPPKSD